MKYLITGGCGFVGSNLSYRLIQEKNDVFIVDNLSRLGSQSNLDWLKKSGDFKFFETDVSNSSSIDKIIKDLKPDVIFHLAGQVAMTTSLQNPRRDFEINALGTINILESARKFSPDSIIVYSSTNKVYGDLEYLEYIEKEKRYEIKNNSLGLDERTSLDFRSPYGCSKGSADQYMLDYARHFALKTIVFRHSSIFGDRQFSTFDQGWIGWFVSQAILIKNDKLKSPITISGNGKQVRDVLFASDLIECYMLAVKNSSNCIGKAYNIGGGYNNSISLLELFDFLNDFFSIKIQYKELPWRSSDQKVFIANISKANKDFNFMPLTNKFEGIKKMIDWVKLEDS